MSASSSWMLAGCSEIKIAVVMLFHYGRLHALVTHVLVAFRWHCLTSPCSRGPMSINVTCSLNSTNMSVPELMTKTSYEKGLKTNGLFHYSPKNLFMLVGSKFHHHNDRQKLKTGWMNFWVMTSWSSPWRPQWQSESFKWVTKVS
jgi:hypothetical protein